MSKTFRVPRPMPGDSGRKAEKTKRADAARRKMAALRVALKKLQPDAVQV